MLYWLTPLPTMREQQGISYPIVTTIILLITTLVILIILTIFITAITIVVLITRLIVIDAFRYSGRALGVQLAAHIRTQVFQSFLPQS